MIRAVVCFAVGVHAGIGSAIAEPAPTSRAFFRASPSVTVASLHRVLTYNGFDGPFDMVEMVDTVDTTRPGGQLELAAGVQLGASLQLGGVLRYALVPNVGGVANGPNERLDYLVLAPQATVFATRQIYVRGELGFGRISHDLVDAKGVSTGVELGYGTLIDDRFIQVGVAASLARTSSQEDGDHGTYDDRFRLVTISAVLSMNLGRHP